MEQTLRPVELNHVCDKIGCDRAATFVGYFQGRYRIDAGWSYACPEHEGELRVLTRPPSLERG